MKMKSTTVYLPEELVAKARNLGFNLSALFERTLHNEVRDIILLGQWKELFYKQADALDKEISKDPQDKIKIAEELARLRQLATRLEGDAYVKVGE